MGGHMIEADEKKLEQLVLKLRATHDEIGRLIESDPNAALQLLENARNELYELVDAYGTILEVMKARIAS
jgi:hypothetical protein